MRPASDVLDLFRPATRAWFSSTFDEPTPAQIDGWRAIAAGRHTLIYAPTGSGKTLAAFLWCIDRLDRGPRRRRPAAAGVPRALRLAAEGAHLRRRAKPARAARGIALAAAALESAGAGPVGTRTGDTSAEDRRLLARHPPDILITTPNRCTSC